MRELRKRRGWSAAELADRCADKGLVGFNRSVLANLESGRRKYVSVEELLTLAYVLDVAPVHLLVPVEADESVDEHRYLICPDVFLPVPEARSWVTGDHAPAAVDPRQYYSEVPLDMFGIVTGTTTWTGTAGGVAPGTAVADQADQPGQATDGDDDAQR